MLAVFCSPFPSRKGGEGDRSSCGAPPAPFPACQENRRNPLRFSWQAGKADLIFCVRPHPLTPFPKWEGGIYKRERLSYPFERYLWDAILVLLRYEILRNPYLAG